MQQRNDPRNIVDDSPMAYQDMTEEAGDGAKGAANTAREKASMIGDKAQDRADAGIDKAAGSLASAAQKLKERAGDADGLSAEAGARVAGGMDKAAGYLRERDTSAILDDVQAFVKEHPMRAVVGAVVGGFLISRILR